MEKDYFELKLMTKDKALGIMSLSSDGSVELLNKITLNKILDILN